MEVQTTKPIAIVETYLTPGSRITTGLLGIIVTTMTATVMSTKPFWSIHTHSKFSANDALPAIPDMVNLAVELGYPALGLTDHGTVAGAVQLYKACRKSQVEPLPGEEFYITPDRENRVQANHHMTVVAYSEQGYRNLVGLHNLAQSNFFYKPRIDVADIAELASMGRLHGLAGSSGCFFGLVVQTLIKHGDRAAQQLVEAMAGWFPRYYVELHNHEVIHYDEPDYSIELPKFLATDVEYIETVREREEIGELKNKSRVEKHVRIGNRLDKIRADRKEVIKTQYQPKELFRDSDIVARMVAIADAAGVPYIIAQDSHYLRPEDQNLHNSLKTLVSFSPDPSEAIFPGGPYSMFSTEDLKPLYSPQVLETACDNLMDLAERTHVRLPELEEFRLRVPDVTITGDAYAELEQRVSNELSLMTTARPEHTQRLSGELEIVRASGFSDYLMLAAFVCDFMRDKDIWFQTRGSASGSFVCYLLGITQIDPVVYDLRMDRFMSTDRMKPPDIDLDVEHGRRDEVVKFLGDKWSVRQIGSHMKYSVVADNDNSDEDQSKGSLIIKYLSTARKKGSLIRKWDDIKPSDQATLKKLGDLKLIAQAGTHAAGYLVSPDEYSARTVPLIWIASRKAAVTAYAMKDVEALGFVKLDLLGLRTLTAIKTTCQSLQWDYEAYTNIPLKDPKVFARISRGDTSGVFQLDGWAMTKGCKELKPKNLEDLIAAQALYRPATMSSGATKDFTKRRALLDAVPNRHSDIQAETANTYGVLLYQEQVIGVLRRMGMEAKRLTEMLGAVKASNEHSAGAADELERAKPEITVLAQARGWVEADIDWLLNALVAYGEYSFNRAHAASYGLTAYRTAWLAQNHPVEFWLGILTAYEAHTREKDFISAARAHNVEVRRANVNTSGIGYRLTPRQDAILKGLVSVKGIGMVTAAEISRHQPYRSLRDLCHKVIPQKVTGSLNLAKGMHPDTCGGSIQILSEAGALDGLNP